MKMEFDKVDVLLNSLGVVGFLFAACLCKQAIEAESLLKTIGCGAGTAWFFEFGASSFLMEAYLLWDKKQLLEEKKKRNLEEISTMKL